VTSSWRPQRVLPVHRSSHLFDVACGPEVLQQIYQSCNKHESAVVAKHPWHPLLIVTLKDLRRLLSYSSPISDSVMTLYLEKLTIHYGITYLATSYLYTLKLQGWERLQSYFAGYRNRPRTNSRPCITGESAIILPCFVDGCHWVVVVRREVEGRVLFLYADDLSNITTEANIKELLSTKTSSAFYPPLTKWIKCKNFTYRPHSNECSPRSLLAATILALHPAPSQDILMPLMHNNLAQIARTWVGSQLLQATFDEATITQFLLPNKLHWPHQTSAISEPADSIQWTSNAVTNIYQSEYAVSSKEGYR
jgi:hypothetical protein